MRAGPVSSRTPKAIAIGAIALPNVETRRAPNNRAKFGERSSPPPRKSFCPCSREGGAVPEVAPNFPCR